MIRIQRWQFSDAHTGCLWLCKEGVGLRRERRRQPGNSFRRPKTSDEYTDYIAVIYLTVEQSNGLRMRWNLAGGTVYLHYNKTAPTFNPFREHFYAAYKIIFRRCRGRLRVCLAQNGQRRELGKPERMQVLWKHMDAMHMMLWDEMHNKNKMQNNR